MVITKGANLVKARHPWYTEHADRLKKWRLAYEGGDDFIEQFTRRYSKRETDYEFRERKAMTYNPNHTKRIVNSIRNSLAAKLPEVTRKGDKSWLDLITTNVDGKNQSINTFLSMNVVPWLLTQRRVYVVVDAPEKEDGVTKADDEGVPYAYWLSAEDVLSYTTDVDSGKITVALIAEQINVVDEDSGLTTKCEKQFRYMRYLAPGEEFGDFIGEGVVIVVYDKHGKQVGDSTFIPEMTRAPIVMFDIPCSVVEDIAQIQVGLLNLASTDMSFLWRANFPIFRRQVRRDKKLAPRMGTKKKDQTPTTQDRDVDDDDLELNNSRRNNAVGTMTGVQYEEELDAPDFTAPPTDNLRASMEKQANLEELMQEIADLALTTLSIKALEQSGKSKEMDQVGKDAGLFYIGSVLENGERELADIFYEFLGLSGAPDVNYPTDYSTKSQAVRNLEVKELNEIKKAIGNKEYQIAIAMRMVEVACRNWMNTEEITKIQKAIENGVWVDDSETRAGMLQADVTAGIAGPPSVSALRGYDPAKEATEVLKYQSQQANLLSGGNVDPATGEGKMVPKIDPETGEPMVDEETGEPIMEPKGPSASEQALDEDGNPIPKAPIDPAKAGEVPVDKQTPVEPLDINGAVATGIIELVKNRILKLNEARVRLGLPPLPEEEAAAIEEELIGAKEEAAALNAQMGQKLFGGGKLPGPPKVDPKTGEPIEDELPEDGKKKAPPPFAKKAPPPFAKK